MGQIFNPAADKSTEIAAKAPIASPAFTGQFNFPKYSTTQQPNAGVSLHAVVMFTDAPGGPILAYADGESWRNFVDHAVIP